MALEALQRLHCGHCHTHQTCFGFTSQSFGANDNEVIVSTEFVCAECGNVVETHIDVEPFIDSIPTTAQLRTEIIGILMREWRYDESAAVEQSDSTVFYAARRKYHYLKARGGVDQFTPSLPRVTASDERHFATDEAARAWLLYQQSHDEPRSITTVRRNRRSRSLTAIAMPIAA